MLYSGIPCLRAVIFHLIPQSMVSPQDEDADGFSNHT